MPASGAGKEPSTLAPGHDLFPESDQGEDTFLSALWLGEADGHVAVMEKLPYKPNPGELYVEGAF